MSQENSRPSGNVILQTESLPFAEIPAQSKLFLEYQKNPLKLKKFYPNAVESHTQISAQIPEVLANYKVDRNLLCDALTEINNSFRAGEKTLENIELLRDKDCVAVVAGQQAGLFSGPIYTIYKALSAVRLAQCLSERGFKAVPIFWIAEEDHDFDEVRNAFVLDKDGKLAEVENTPENYVENIAVGNVKLDENIDETLQNLTENLSHTEFSDELQTLLKETYQPNETFSTSFAKFLMKLFEKYGVIFFAQLDKKLKNLAVPIFQEAVEKSDEIRKSLLERNKKLEDENFHTQVLVDDNFFPFFEFDEAGKRQKISKNEIKNFQNLSPNALMRPVVQDYLLPTICYFGGGAEIAYFAQNSVIYEILNRPVTPILHRQSFTVIESKHRKTLEKYDLELKDLFAGIENLLPKIVEEYLNEDTAKLFDEVEANINIELNHLNQNLSKIEPTLAENLANKRKKIDYHIANLRNKFHHAQIRKDEIINRRIETAFTALLPHGHLQERTLNVTSFLNRYGLYFIDWIYEAIDLDDKEHRIIYL